MENSRILIVHHTLGIGGGEKLVYELSKFYKKNQYNPIVLIINNSFKSEYYDEKLRLLGVEVERVKILSKKNLLKFNIGITDLKWFFLMKTNLNKKFKAVIFINLVVATLYHRKFKFSKKIFWHVGNSIQYENYSYPFDKSIFYNKLYRLVLINKYQKKELENDFGEIISKIVNINLFENECN